MDELLKEADRLLALSENELFAMLGDRILARRFGIEEPTDDDRVDEGKDWWQENLARLRTLLCGSELLKNADSMIDEPRGKLVILIGDLIAQHFTVIPPLTVAAIILQMSRGSFCPDDKGTKLPQQ